MSSVPGSIFTGSSQFSTDFANVIQRAVQLAGLPMQQMQNDVVRLTSQSSELSTLGSDFTALQTAIGNLNSALGASSYSSSATSSVSGATVASVALSGTPNAGTYTLEVAGVGSYATAISNGARVSDPTKSSINDSSTFTLAVGGVPTTIKPSGNTLSALVSAINTSGAGVQATMVNVGSTASPNYQLSLQNSQLASVVIQLTALNGSNPGTLLPGVASGAAATYRVDGAPASPATLSSNSATITLSPGVSATMLTPGTSTITVTQNTSAVSTALSSFVTAYNAVQAEIANNRGTGKGALQGQSVLMSLSSALGQIVKYSNGNSGISSLASLGLSYSSSADGTLSFDASKFSTATTGQITQLASFLGSTSTGGFLKGANDILTGITDPINGIIPTGVNTLQGEIAIDNQNISDQQTRVDALQTSMTNQMAAADAAISSMEQQYSYLYSMFQAMQINAQNGG